MTHLFHLHIQDITVHTVQPLQVAACLCLVLSILHVLCACDVQCVEWISKSSFVCCCVSWWFTNKKINMGRKASNHLKAWTPNAEVMNVNIEDEWIKIILNHWTMNLNALFFTVIWSGFHFIYSITNISTNYFSNTRLWILQLQFWYYFQK